MRSLFVLLAVACAPFAASRACADERDDLVKLLTKELQAQRDDLARLREENKKLREENEKLRQIAAKGGGADAKVEKAKSPKAAIVGEWKHIDRAETLAFSAKGEWFQRTKSEFLGVSTNRGTYRFTAPDRIELRGGLLVRVCTVHVDGDTLILEQRAPVALSMADEYERQAKK